MKIEYVIACSEWEAYEAGVRRFWADRCCAAYALPSRTATSQWDWYATAPDVGSDRSVGRGSVASLHEAMDAADTWLQELCRGRS